MTRISLFIPFSISFFFLIFGSIFLPKIQLMFFAPFFSALFVKKTLTTSLWITCLCGLLVDIFSSELRFGFYALTYSLTALLTHRQKYHLVEESLWTFFLFTTYISFLATIIHLLLFQAFDKKISFSLHSILLDLILMPFLDGSFAFLCFTIPLRSLNRIQHLGLKAFFQGMKVDEK